MLMTAVINNIDAYSILSKAPYESKMACCKYKKQHHKKEKRHINSKEDKAESYTATQSLSQCQALTH